MVALGYAQVCSRFSAIYLRKFDLDNQKYCSKCGVASFPDATFCESCGTRFAHSSASPPPFTPPSTAQARPLSSPQTTSSPQKSTGERMQTVGRTMTLYLTGFIIVLVLLVLFFPLGLIAFLIWLFFIYRSRKSNK
jgi:hypothetical protein